MAHNPGFLKLVNDSRSKIKELTIDQVVERFKSPKPFFFVDVREDSEWCSSHCKGAVHIGKGVIERDIETEMPEKNAEIILYCGGGFRSALAAEVLQQMGYTDVASMDGGFRGWCQKNLPVEKPSEV